MDNQFGLFHPFGPKIGIFTLDKELVKLIDKDVNEILDDKNREDYGNSLAGQIATEIKIPETNHTIYGFFADAAKHYVEQVYAYAGFTEENGRADAVIHQSRINSAWIVQQIEGEYNPAHTHGGCNVSGVLYVQIPDYQKRFENTVKPEMDGMLDFINNSSRLSGELESGNFPIKPKVGTLYVFPSRLYHTVYPFLGDGKRISVSFNAIVV
mgnify:FL=1|tara:strand:+ start:320 stop:952 length:633 start_codon:yes stop_codon:yes gene_type:complete